MLTEEEAIKKWRAGWRRAEPAAEASPAAAGGPAWCSSLWGHRFVARYSYRPPARVKGEAELAADFARAMTIRTYECDVCVRCGVVVKRP